MVLNDVLFRQSVFTKIVLKSGSKELSKELKVKVMRIRIAYNKIKNEFDSEIQNFVQELMTDEYKNLVNKEERSKEENSRLEELVASINSDCTEYINQKGKEVVQGIDDSLTLDEYAEILEVNAGGNFDINDTKVSPEDFLELIYVLFVKETNS
jgi:hypothetical protein